MSTTEAKKTFTCKSCKTVNFLEDAMLLIGEVYKAAGTVEIEADDEE